MKCVWWFGQNWLIWNTIKVNVINNISIEREDNAKRLPGSGSNKKLSYYHFLLTQSPSPKELSIIHADLDRTFPTHKKFRNKSGNGQKRLYNVLYAYCVHDHEVGYCQGMGFIAALMLMYYQEEDAFYILVALLRDKKYNMRGLFMPGLPLLHQRFHQLSYLMKRHCPKAHAKLELNKSELERVYPAHYATQWFLLYFYIKMVPPI
eukprot:UN22951